jgi:hypothetical protein
MVMPDRDDVIRDEETELASLSLLLLTWILERQGQPAPGGRSEIDVDETAAEAALSLSRHLLRRADSHSPGRLSTPEIQRRFASLITSGCQEAGDHAAPLTLDVLSLRSPCIERAGTHIACLDRAVYSGQP